MLCLTVLPVLGVWSYSVYMLSDTISLKSENEATRKSLEYSVELGKLVHHLQKERDMSVLYLSALRPETKTFLLAEYVATDRAITKLPVWPGDLDKLDRTEFSTRANLVQYLNRRRQSLTPSEVDIQDEIDFYTRIIKVVIEWLYDSINESKFAVVWKTLVAYQKMTSAKEDVGVERALGTMFYANGGFENHQYYQMYYSRVHNFRAFYKTAQLYSDRVRLLYSFGVSEAGNNVTDIIDSFRYEILHNTKDANSTAPDLQKARWWFDNMTMYLDTLLDVQQDLGEEILAILDYFIEKVQTDLAVSATLLVVVILMCPFVIYMTEYVTSVFHKYALTLIEKTKELTKEKHTIDTLLYQMIPKPIANQLKHNKSIKPEYYKTVTVLASDVYGFYQMSLECSALQVVELLNTLYDAIDELSNSFDMYKLETLNDCYMAVSGLPDRNKHHAVEVATFALNLVELISKRQFIINENRIVQVRIGINTGPCMAGIVGSMLPRFCVVGETVNLTARMMFNSSANRINVSKATYASLAKSGQFLLKKRINSQSKTPKNMYWLIKKLENGLPTKTDASDSESEDSARFEREEDEKDDLELADIPFPFRQRLPMHNDDEEEECDENHCEVKDNGKNRKSPLEKKDTKELGQIMDESQLNLM
ncbi:hypothetical protein FSP39_016564 [Pinctada imbricata]|uniref:guanylate cyclase n=1 Tax=Pinctada imbricata TaxID=66713 RepID=A0AA89BZI8_PINIB|nr:hypothetical protein FSP39_016564 [Pinctada imbricata]